jgi:hypothetical protein
MWEFLKLPIRDISDMRARMECHLLTNNCVTETDPLFQQINRTFESIAMDAYGETLPPAQDWDDENLQAVIDSRMQEYRTRQKSIKSVHSFFTRAQQKLHEEKTEFLLKRSDHSRATGQIIEPRNL